MSSRFEYWAEALPRIQITREMERYAEEREKSLIRGLAEGDHTLYGKMADWTLEQHRDWQMRDIDPGEVARHVRAQSDGILFESAYYLWLRESRPGWKVALSPPTESSGGHASKPDLLVTADRYTETTVELKYNSMADLTRAWLYIDLGTSQQWYLNRERVPDLMVLGWGLDHYGRREVGVAGFRFGAEFLPDVAPSVPWGNRARVGFAASELHHHDAIRELLRTGVGEPW